MKKKTTTTKQEYYPEIDLTQIQINASTKNKGGEANRQ